jgi:hypothetical protein
MNTMLECFVLQKVEQARIKVETSQGWMDKTVAIVEREAIEGLYFVLKQQKNMAVVVANCLDAAVTGSNSSAVGAGCDFITSMLAIGDVRDLLIQSWNYHFNEEEFDALSASLSGVGIVASIAQLAGGIGVAPAALVAAAKTLAKRLRRFGPVGLKTAKVLGEVLERIVRDPNLPISEKARRIGQLTPVFEIGASVALIQQTDPRLFGLLVHAMSTPNKFERFSTWMLDYLARLGAELTPEAAAQNTRQRHWLDYLVSPAYADFLSSVVREAFIEAMRKIVARTERIDIEEVALSFDEAVEKFIDLKGNDTLYALREVSQDEYVIKAFMNVDAIGKEAGADMVRHFARNSGWTIGMNDVFSVEAMVKSVADMRVDRLIHTPAEVADALDPAYAAQVRQGLKGVVNRLESPIGQPVTKGHMAHWLIVVDLLDSGAVIRNIEVSDAAIELLNGMELAYRRMDIELEIDGRVYYWDVKNNMASTWRDNLTAAFGNKIRKVNGEAIEEPGQLITDLGKLYKTVKEGQPEQLRQWVFTPDVLGQAGKPTAEQIASMETTMTEHIVGLIDDPKYRDALIGHLDIDKEKLIEEDLVEIRKFNKAKNDLIKMINGTYPNMPGNTKFIKIYSFDSLVPPGA